MVAQRSLSQRLLSKTKNVHIHAIFFCQPAIRYFPEPRSEFDMGSEPVQWNNVAHDGAASASGWRDNIKSLHIRKKARGVIGTAVLGITRFIGSPFGFVVINEGGRPNGTIVVERVEFTGIPGGVRGVGDRGSHPGHGFNALQSEHMAREDGRSALDSRKLERPGRTMSLSGKQEAQSGYSFVPKSRGAAPSQCKPLTVQHCFIARIDPGHRPLLSYNSDKLSEYEYEANVWC
ncbi:hypothetical protein FB451DRAFT_1180950 [Mycena latifolia]|nr:hypothetical protein FB451DRAFT_1180950 [Mycena latifolia]